MSRRDRNNRNNTKHSDQIERSTDQKQDSSVKRNHDFDNLASDEMKHKSLTADSVKSVPNELNDRSDGKEDLNERRMQQVLDELEKQMDKEYMMAGKVIAEMLRLVHLTSLKLPDMELHTDMIDIIKNQKHTTVIIHHAFIENRDDTSHRSGIYLDPFDISDEPCEADDDDIYSIGNYDEDDIDEEERIYDAD